VFARSYAMDTVWGEQPITHRTLQGVIDKTFARRGVSALLKEGWGFELTDSTFVHLAPLTAPSCGDPILPPRTHVYATNLGGGRTRRN
jgi:hypothetical protein